MKTLTNIFLAISLLLMSNYTHGQEGYSNFDQAMISLANEVAQRVQSKNKLQVAVWNFTNTRGASSELGNYIARDFSIHFTNASSGFQVNDRDHMEQILKEHELNTEGFVDPATAKEIGRLVAADAIVTGTVDVGLHHLRLRIKIIDTETGRHFAAGLRNLPIDENIKIILEETEFDTPSKSKSSTPRLDSGETEKDARQTEEDCEHLNTGIYCFTNQSNVAYLIDIRGVSNGFRQSITLDPGQDRCLYDVPSGTYSYSKYPNKLRIVGSNDKGSFRVEACKSITYKLGRRRMGTIKTKGNDSQEKRGIPLKQILDVVEPLITKKKQ